MNTEVKMTQETTQPSDYSVAIKIVRSKDDDAIGYVDRFLSEDKVSVVWIGNKLSTENVDSLIPIGELAVRVPEEPEEVGRL
jgi:hypothetical protein